MTAEGVRLLTWTILLCAGFSTKTKETWVKVSSAEEENESAFEISTLTLMEKKQVPWLSPKSHPYQITWKTFLHAYIDPV